MPLKNSRLSCTGSYTEWRNATWRATDWHTLQTTALVNEVYLRLVDCSRVNWQDRAHFLAVSAQLMRRILIDFARSVVTRNEAVM